MLLPKLKEHKALRTEPGTQQTPSKCELAVTIMITITFSGWEIKPTKNFHFQVIYLYIFVCNIHYLYNHIPVRFIKTF